MRTAPGVIVLGAAIVSVALWSAPAQADESAAGSDTAAARVDTAAVDEDWLNTVWSQVDDMVKEEEYELQETVTVAAVRGAEAEDNILDKLYYKGGRRYPSQDKLRKAIETLKKAIAADPRAEDVPKQRYFIAQCHEKLGQADEARSYYAQIVKAHPETPWAEKSSDRLAALNAAD